MTLLLHRPAEVTRTDAVRPAPTVSLPAVVSATAKVLAALASVVAVVAVPARMVWPYLVDLAIVLAVLAVARVPWRRLRRALLVEAPFAAFAVLVPFVAAGPRVHVAGIGLSVPGLWSAWGLVAKATLGALTALCVAATTRGPDLLDALHDLRLPARLVEIASFMVRYLDVVRDQWQRMGIARASRGFTARRPRDWVVMAQSLGTLFVACYERGERVHVAMLSRGYTGSLPRIAAPERRTRWWPVVLPAALVVAVTVCARWWV
ncbi:cobalt ECF transporter T component CbiQ [Luteococcus sanguinis]|uniref:Cobalt ECF transporter T component CbiQ n=1 Tax=Luteococcus sanguinis TaxID=174038 RepID=A0ABW1X2V7_9ACTN